MSTGATGGVVWMPVGGECNSRCEACTVGEHSAVTPQEVRAAAGRTRPAVLVLTGPGEPLLRRDLDELVHAARRGCATNVALVTNGRALAYPRLAGAVASLAFSHVIVTLLDARPDEHDRMTRSPGSHEQTLTGIRNLSRLVADGRTSIVARTLDADGLEPLASLVSGQGASGVWLDADDPPDPPPLPGLVSGTDIERVLLGAVRDAGDVRGPVPARFHEDERAVSLVIGTGCRNACSFCTTRLIQEQSRSPWRLDDLSLFHEALEEGSSRSYESLRIVAVEPLEHPDLPDLISRARDLGYTRIEAWSSGRALADGQWARRLARAGLTAVDVVLLGSSAAVHDAVARAPGAFDETMAGIDSARGLLDVSCHAVLVRQNLDDLGGIIRLAHELGLGDPSPINVPAPSTDTPAHYAAFAARMSDIARAAAGEDELVRHGLSRYAALWNIPPCILERTPGLQLPAPSSPVAPESDIREGKLESPGTGVKLRSPCPSRDRCAAGDRCPGYHEQYVQVHGTGELLPL